MAFRKSNYKRRTFKKSFPKKSSWRSMVEKGISMGKLVASGAYAAKTIYGLYNKVNSELKRTDITHSVSVTNTGSIIPLMQLAEGDDVSDRNGRKVLAHDIISRLRLTQNTSAVSTNVRIMLFIDTMQRGADPAVTDVLQNVTVYSPLEYDTNKGRFVVIYDKVFSMSTNGNTAKVVKIYKKLKFHVAWSGTSAATANQGKNQPYFLFLSDEPTNTPNLSGETRVKFYDN